MMKCVVLALLSATSAAAAATVNYGFESPEAIIRISQQATKLSGTILLKEPYNADWLRRDFTGTRTGDRITIVINNPIYLKYSQCSGLSMNGGLLLVCPNPRDGSTIRYNMRKTTYERLDVIWKQNLAFLKARQTSAEDYALRQRVSGNMTYLEELISSYSSVRPDGNSEGVGIKIRQVKLGQKLLPYVTKLIQADEDYRENPCYHAAIIGLDNAFSSRKMPDTTSTYFQESVRDLTSHAEQVTEKLAFIRDTVRSSKTLSTGADLKSFETRVTQHLNTVQKDLQWMKGQQQTIDQLISDYVLFYPQAVQEYGNLNPAWSRDVYEAWEQLESFEKNLSCGFPQ